MNPKPRHCFFVRSLEFPPTPRPRNCTLGTYYRSYLAELLRPDQCPAQDDVFFWADLDERTRDTGQALLGGFRPNCDVTKYFHTAEPPAPDNLAKLIELDPDCSQ